MDIQLLLCHFVICFSFFLGYNYDAFNLQVIVCYLIIFSNKCPVLCQKPPKRNPRKQ